MRTKRKIKYGFTGLPVWKTSTRLKTVKNSSNRPFSFLGENISKRRNLAEKSQDDFAAEAGVGISTLKDIERGVAEGRLETRLAIADRLDCTLDELYQGAPQPKRGTPTPYVDGALDLLSKFQGLPPDLKRIAATVIYQDTRYLKGIPPERARAMAQAIAALFQPIQKAGQK